MSEPERNRPPVIVIVGPTGVGKTAASILIGQRLSAEIINADSRSFYRGMDIGTAKVSPADQAEVPHHLIDILDPDEPMSLATFQDVTYATIDSIHARGHVPLLVGGTPQYVNAVVEGWSIPRVPPNEEFRSRMEVEAKDYGVEPILARLARVDSISAERIGPNLRRVIRALEVFEATGTPISVLQTKQPVFFSTVEFELWAPRDVLYSRIDARVDEHIERGLVQEVAGLLEKGLPPDAAAMSSIGYRQVLPYLSGKSSLEDVVERIKLDSHRLVRHQQTWFRKNPRLVRIDASEPEWLEILADKAERFVETWLGVQKDVRAAESL